MRARTELNNAIRERLNRLNQNHVLYWWDSLSESSRQQLAAQLETIEWGLLEEMMDRCRCGKEKSVAESEIEPAEYIGLPSKPEEEAEHRKAVEAGEALIREGKVAAFLVAGGQGSRLGFSGPKGKFPIGPVTGKTLFEMHAEKIRAASRAYGVAIPWYIMISETNEDETKAYFEENAYLGFPESDVIFFKQRMLPAVDGRGRMMMDAKDHIFMSPNGHGGSLLALYESGAVADMQRRGISLISYFQVDNVLIHIVDPRFFGFHYLANAQMSSKMVAKRDADEKVGVFGLIDNKLHVVEYSELTKAQKNARDSNGSLLFGSGSIAIHVINVDFVEKVAKDGFKLPYYLAHKKIPVIDDEGKTGYPESPNGYKFESFVFDALTLADRSIILEVARQEEFSGVKNAQGEDSPRTAKRDISAFFAEWLEAAGIEVPKEENGIPIHHIEISPLFARNREEFIRKAASSYDLTKDLYLGPG